MNRKEKIDQLVTEVKKSKDIDRLYDIAKELSGFHAWAEYSNTIKRIMEVEDEEGISNETIQP